MNLLSLTILVASTIASTVDEVARTSSNTKIFVGASAVAAIFAGLSLLKVVQDYIGGGSDIRFYEVIRPLIMVILVANFNALILTPWNFLANRVSSMCDTGTRVSMTNYSKAAQAALEKCVNYNDLKQTRKDNIKQSATDIVAAGKKLGERLKAAYNLSRQVTSYLGNMLTIDQLNSWFNKIQVQAFCEMTGVTFTEELGMKHIPASVWFFGIMSILANAIMYICQIAFEIYAKGIMYVLSYVGVISFTLGTWERFRNSIDTWLASYLKVSLWLPLFHIACSYIYSSGGALMNSLASKGESPVGLEDFLVMLSTCLVTIIITTKIDTLSDMIVSGGSNAAAGGMTSISSGTSKAVTIATKIAS